MSLDDDPTDFDGSLGILPVVPPDSSPPVLKDSRSNAATGASAAGVRAFSAQAVAFYFRAPVKAFFRTRVDYLVGHISAMRGMQLIADNARRHMRNLLQVKSFKEVASHGGQRHQGCLRMRLEIMVGVSFPSSSYHHFLPM